MRRLLFLFLDGVGIGPDDPERNPFLRAKLPVLREMLGGGPPVLPSPERAGPDARAFPLDATLGVEGTPQSGTGQTSLLTGRNGAHLFGRHFGPWIPVRLRPVVEEESLLRRAVDAGLPTVFANAYPEGWPGPAGDRRIAGPPLAARGAGLLTRHVDALRRSEAVSSGIVNDGWRALGIVDLPRITAEEAGRNLARIAAGARLTLFAHWATDHAGHRGGPAGSVAALERVDAFLGGIRAEAPDVTLLVASDHGNVEEAGGGHTLNPVLGMAAGPGSEELARGLTSIMDVPGRALAWLGVE